MVFITQWAKVYKVHLYSNEHDTIVVMENTNEHLGRHGTTGHDNEPRPVTTVRDIGRYTMTVPEAVVEFSAQGFPLTERTIQRYCLQHKLDAVKVDPLTRQPADSGATMLLIDATTVATRIELVRKNQVPIDPTPVATDPDPARHDATTVATSREPVGVGVTAENSEEIEKLNGEINSLQIDKAVRDQRIEQFKEDRKELIGQLEGFVDRLTTQAHQIGSLETQLQLSAPAIETDPNNPEIDRGGVGE